MQARRSALFICATQPIPSGSAACVRTIGMARALRNNSWSVHCATVQRPLEHAEGEMPLPASFLPPNDPDAIASCLTESRPDVVIFDRHYIEEMFAHQVADRCPQALRVLDLQDLHSLREGRRQLVNAGGSIADSVAHRPAAASSDLLCRELASIHRSDLTLTCSDFEASLLTSSSSSSSSCEGYGIPSHKIKLARFITDTSSATLAASGSGAMGFENRCNFATIGSALHKPNVDSLEWTVRHVWPLIRAKAAAAEQPFRPELHVFGSHFGEHAMKKHHRPQDGVHMRGFAETLDVLGSFRLLLAPLRYGAGIKGKVADGWRHGLPAITTPVGSEGMMDTVAKAGEEQEEGPAEQAGAEWGGRCGATTAEGLAHDAFTLYEDAVLWGECQRRGRQLVTQLFGYEFEAQALVSDLELALDQMEGNRRRDTMMAMLWHQSLDATRFKSKWIVEKNRNLASAREG